ncbi:MAG: hypothetical protein EBR86_15090 [Planctomycetia bacterium]|nr:hypothetical protein [Planctomycetia bacterium]
MTDDAQPSRDEARGRRPRRRSVDGLRLARRESAAGDVYELVHPRCARRRRDDLEEVEAMLEAGEDEIARDELVWLLSECPDFIEAHVHLGLLALEAEDVKLARGHFGRGCELVFRLLDAAGGPRPLPHALPGNRPFFEAAKGLVHCLAHTGRMPLARETVRRVTALDPSDPLAVARLLETPPDRKGGGR